MQEGNDHDFVLIEPYEFGREDVAQVIKDLRTGQYSASSSSSVNVMCKNIMEKDYACEFVDNTNGVLCENYPQQLIIPVAKKTAIRNERSMNFEISSYTDKVEKSVAARILKRFAAPVILFDDKFICRSGTLSNRRSAALSTATTAEDPKPEVMQETVAGASFRMASQFVGTVCHTAGNFAKAATGVANPNWIEDLRCGDRDVLKECNVLCICDLMKVVRKTYSNMVCGSSEKASEVYGGFRIEKMPYPGAEFFSRYSRNNRNAKDLVFDWNSEDVEVVLELTEYPDGNFKDVDWTNYKEWDIITLTKNYMKILLFNLVKKDGSLLVHCSCGWNRTSLFTSLLRVSLWADGVIHESLSISEMAYLTLGYDWYLFGHDLKERVSRREEIMHFCFKFLPEIADNEFSVTRMFQELTSEQRANRDFPDFPEFQEGKRFIDLHLLSDTILDEYESQITLPLEE